jgi:prepilin-type N-terminal cleavage/methylation domain-containing protein
MSRGCTPTSEDGFSLAEILVTIAIVGIACSALLGGLMTSISASALQQKQATADGVARSTAEWLKDSVRVPYVNCAGTNAYSLSGVPVPTGFSVSVTAVDYWNGATPAVGAYAPVFQSSCPSPDTGLQRITVVARSSDGQATESLQLLKRTAA